MKRPLIVIAAVVVTALLAIGIVQTSGTEEQPAGVAPSPQAAREALAGAPPPLEAVHRDANALLDAADYDERIRSLRGYPIVVNVWGSWCTPCREEFPIFQRVATKLGKEVAFLGVATQDSRENAGAFLEDHPLTYPSYMDFDGKLADSFGLIAAPATLFIDKRGRRSFLHQGKYSSDAGLIEDIERYGGA